MLGHTPGPWVTDTSHWQDREGVTIWAESNIIADVVPDHHNQEEANARLIALAPTLLRIVKTLLASWECDPDEDAQHENLMDKAVARPVRP